MTDVGGHPASGTAPSAGHMADRDLAAVLAGSLAAHRLRYPEDAEALASLAEDLAGIRGLGGPDRDIFMAVARQGMPAGQAAPTASEDAQAAPASGSQGQAGTPDG